MRGAGYRHAGDVVDETAWVGLLWRDYDRAGIAGLLMDAAVFVVEVETPVAFEVAVGARPRLP